MTDTILPPEVAEACETLDAEVAPAGKVSYEAYRAWCTIHGYLHQVTAENEQIRSVADEAELNREGIKHAHAELRRVKAELAALKARVEAAPVFTCDAEVISGRGGDYMSMILTHADSTFQYPDLDDQHVRLVVEPEGGK